ncbi:universal stress protein [Amycolatopsis sp. NPDC058986]|uniref:universal stress protein n=1 Tax=unclassified Amycolatopsis TaxID=2618356 RepID=UPI00366B709F
MITNESGGGPVVVGTDGSQCARQAVTWAVGEAAAMGRGLLIVRAARGRWPPPGADLLAAPLAGAPTTHDVILDTRQRLAGLAAEVRQQNPGTVVETALRDGPPEEALVAVAEDTDAAMIVLGASGSGAFARLLLGSTAAEVARTAFRPVVVVRGPSPHPANAGPVVLGVDGSDQGSAAARFAFAFAERHRLAVHAVHAWLSPTLGPAFGPAGELGLAGQTPGLARDELSAAATKAVHQALRPCTERHPDVEVTHEVVEDLAAKALLDRSADATLLVVGSHGGGELRRVLLGSVGHAVLYHADCPVAVVRPPEKTEPPD